MKLFIFKTNIETKRMTRLLKPYFNSVTSIVDWHIDVQDVDKVLRIEAKESLTEQDIIHLIQTKGFYCEPLKD